MAAPGFDRVAEAQRLLEQLRLVDTAIREAEARLRELEEAKRAIEKFKGKGSVYREVGGLLVEIDWEEAERYVADEIELLQARLTRLRRERSELEKKLRELLHGLGVGVGVSTALAK